MTRQPDDDPREPAPEDAQWRDIVERLGDDVFSTVPDIIATPMPTQSPVPEVGGQTPPDALDDWDDDEHFIPPSPSLPTLSRRTMMSWVLIGSGLALLTSASVFRFTDTWSTLIGFGAVLAGATSLVLRMSNQAPDEDDDGAVV